MNDFDKALKLALSRISLRDRSTKEIEISLESKGFSDDTIRAVLARLKDKRILDDQRTALNLSRRLKEKGFGPERIRAELERLGIAGESVTDQVSDGASQLAEEALRRKLGSGGVIPRARAWRFLMGRGFSEEDCERALSSVFGEAEEPE